MRRDLSHPRWWILSVADTTIFASLLQSDATSDVCPPLVLLSAALTQPSGFYCMPNEGVQLSPREHILTDDEVVRLASLFVKSGVRKIRLTGGEPTVRKGLDNIIGSALRRLAFAVIRP